MKTLSIAALLLFAFGTATFAQDASATTKTSATTTKTVKKPKHKHEGPPKVKHPVTPAAK